MANPYEYCCECNCTTDRAGAADDSLYAGDHGPFCQECFDALVVSAPRYKRERDRLLAALKEVTFRAHFSPEDEYAQTEALAAIAECGED